MQRQVELDHEGVDQHQVAKRHGAVSDVMRRQEHECGDADGHNQALPSVQRGQRSLIAHRGGFPYLQAVVVAPCLEAFVAEIFHRLVVQQTVDGAGVGLGIHVVHGAAKHHAPFGDDQGEGDIHHERNKSNDGEPDIVFHQQNRCDEADFHQRRQDVEQHEIE